jgi:hypothetical protein
MECQKTIIKDGITTISPKQQYNTNEEAIKACKFLNSYPDRTQKLVPYKCHKCFKFHVGRNGKLIDVKSKSFNKTIEPLINVEFTGFTLVGHIDLSVFDNK